MKNSISISSDLVESPSIEITPNFKQITVREEVKNLILHSDIYDTL